MSMSKSPLYPKGHRHGLVCRQPSKALQSGKEEADINVIVSRFLRTGTLPQAAARPPQYGDLTIQPNLATALMLDLRARDAWQALPLPIRKAAGRMEDFESWLKEPQNTALALQYGVLRKPKAAEQSAATSAATAAPAATAATATPPAAQAASK